MHLGKIRSIGLEHLALAAPVILFLVWLMACVINIASDSSEVERRPKPFMEREENQGLANHFRWMELQAQETTKSVNAELTLYTPIETSPEPKSIYRNLSLMVQYSAYEYPTTVNFRESASRSDRRNTTNWILYYDYNYRPYVGDHYVNGFLRSDGTYVQGHRKTYMDDSFWNNFSSSGNLNPHTGRIGSKAPPLTNYGYGSGTTYVNGYFRQDGRCISGRYK